MTRLSFPIKVAASSTIVFALALGASYAVAAAGNSSNPDESLRPPVVNTKDPSLKVQPAGVLPDGRTYGPFFGYPEPGQDAQEPIPDLIAVLGDNGRVGYADRKVVLGENTPEPSSPEEAVAIQEKLRPLPVPVLDEAGKQIDTFTLNTGVEIVNGQGSGPAE